MKKRSLPAITVAARTGARTHILPSVLDRWNPAVQAATEGDNTISILDTIGEDFFGMGTTAKRISAALRSIGQKPVTVNVNSPGGDYFEGLAIYNLLREHPEPVTVNILGLAASAASVIAMAGDEIRIARAGFLMMHNVWIIAMGDRHDLRDAAEWLETIDASLADLYASRTGMDTKEIGKMLDKETWLGGQKAVDAGFADGLLPSDAAKEVPSEEAANSLTLRKLEAILARAGMPRKERRELLNAIPNVAGAMRDAGPAAMRDAGEKDAAHIQTLLAALRAS